MRRLLVLGILAAVLATQAPAHAITVVINITDFKFVPKKLVHDIDNDISWHNNDATTHNVTVTVKASGTFGANIGPSETSVADSFFRLPGTYRYKCNIHPDMKGSIANLIETDAISKTLGTPFNLRWSPADGSGVVLFDIQFKRKGDDGFRNVFKNTTEEVGNFEPDERGTFFVRARTQNLVDPKENSTDWGPQLKLTVT